MMIYALSSYEKTCQAVYDMGRLLNAGFTSTREVGGFANYLRDPIAKGLIAGPRICSSGRAICQTGGHGDLYQKFPSSFNSRMDATIIADGTDEMRKACREQFRAGADFIKSMTTGGVTSQGDSPNHCQFTMDEIKTAVEEAGMHGTYVATHAQTLKGIKNALKGGVMSIEHCFQIDDEVLELFARTGAWIVPTFTILQCYIKFIDQMPKAVAEKSKWAVEIHMKSIRKAYEAGIKIGYGCDLISDAAIAAYGENNLQEFYYLTQIGMSPMEAITAATKTGAENIKKEKELGTIEEGKLADITVCSGNPLDDIRLLTKVENIKMVMLDGKIIKTP
jgi:imidazolonepropionase-like amidohydrolase